MNTWLETDQHQSASMLCKYHCFNTLSETIKSIYIYIVKHIHGSIGYTLGGFLTDRILSTSFSIIWYLMFSYFVIVCIFIRFA